MKRKFTLAILGILIISLICISFSQATSHKNQCSSNLCVKFNDILLNEGKRTNVKPTGSETQININYHSDLNASDARIKIWIEGLNESISAYTGRFNLLGDSTYSKLLSLQFPKKIKPKKLILHVGIYTATQIISQKEYLIKIK